MISALSEEEDGRRQLKAAKALLNESGLVRVEANKIVVIAETQFEDESKRWNEEFGRLMCWILFSVGAEYLIKAALMAAGEKVRTIKNHKFDYKTLSKVIPTVKKLKLEFAPQSSEQKVEVGKFLEESLMKIRNRDLHYYANGVRAADFTRVNDIAAGGCKKDCVNVVLEENEGERNEIRREKV